MTDRRRIVLVDGDVLWRCVRLICSTWVLVAGITHGYGFDSYAVGLLRKRIDDDREATDD